MKILLAADGSTYTQNAALHLVSHLRWFATAPEVHVVHVQPPLPYPRAQAVAGKAAVHGYQKEESEKALAVAESVLGKAGVPYTSSWSVGEVAPALADYVKTHGIELVVMGTHGHGALASLALGSVAVKCIATLEVPVMVVKGAPRKASTKRR
jgi:nucleotide-binding universal stress UspA family protein